jgi:hypothetical protein
MHAVDVLSLCVGCAESFATQAFVASILLCNFFDHADGIT